LFIPGTLEDKLLNSGHCGILFSGGYDSEVLLRFAVKILGTSSVLSLTADSELLAGFYREHIRIVTGELGVEPLFVPLRLLNIEEFAVNSDKRCYICKKELFTRLKAEAVSHGCKTVMDGSSTDDLKESRPGLIAAAEIGIVHPFIEARMGRKDIAQIGALLGTREEDHPSDSCLATRIPDGERINVELLHLIERMEAPLRPSVKGRFRVRTGTSRLMVNYSAVDKKLIDEYLEHLKRVAEKSGYKIRLHQLDR
jgi:uncharacterized protein